MKNSTILLIAGAGILAWWYFRTNRRRLQISNTAMAKAGGRPRVGVPSAAQQAGLGCNCQPTMGTMYSEDPISGPYGEFNIGGESGSVAPKQHTWDRMEDVSAL